MKKVFAFFAMAAMFAACNTNTPVNPDEQKREEFAKATFFEVIGTNKVPSESYTQDSVRAEAFVKDGNIVSINLYGVGFSARMPLTIDMTIDSISSTRTADRIILSAETVIPTMGGKPFNRYPVVNLNGYISADSLVFTNNYGVYENCSFAGKIISMK
jgi:hypothetical protein